MSLDSLDYPSEIGMFANGIQDATVTLYNVASKSWVTLAVIHNPLHDGYLLRYGNFHLSGQSNIEFDELKIPERGGEPNVVGCPAEGAGITVASFDSNVQTGALRHVTK